MLLARIRTSNSEPVRTEANTANTRAEVLFSHSIGLPEKDLHIFTVSKAFEGSSPRSDVKIGLVIGQAEMELPYKGAL